MQVRLHTKEAIELMTRDFDDEIATTESGFCTLSIPCTNCTINLRILVHRRAVSTPLLHLAILLDREGLVRTVTFLLFVMIFHHDRRVSGLQEVSHRVYSLPCL